MSQSRGVTREKEKGVELRNVEESERPKATSTISILTLKPLPNIDPKDKGKKRIEEDDESSFESEKITTAEKKFKQLSTDEELTRKVQEDWEAEEERKRLAEEEAVNDALVQELDDVKARIEADRLLALRLEEEEREEYTIEERAKFLHDTIAAQRRFLAEQRSAAIRSGKKHADLKNRKFDDIQALYERDKESIEVPAKENVTEQGTKKKKSGHIKMMARKIPRLKQNDENDDELKLSLIVTSDEDKEIDYEILDRKYPIIESNGQKRHFSTLMRILLVFDREDLNGDLMIMFNQGDANEFWNTQQDWKIVYWKLHNSSGVHTLMTETGLVIHMLVDSKYPLKKEVLSQMLKFKLESEEESSMALELIRFVKKKIAELEVDNSDGDEK
ncbi:hypothetical protein Tco_0962660 [Tanacetum coccineum]